MGRTGVAFAAAAAATVSVVALVGSVYWAYQDPPAVAAAVPAVSAPPVVTQAPPVAHASTANRVRILRPRNSRP